MGITKYQLNAISTVIDQVEKIGHFKYGIFSVVGVGDIFLEKVTTSPGTSKVEVTFLDDKNTTTDGSKAYDELQKLAGK